MELQPRRERSRRSEGGPLQPSLPPPSSLLGRCLTLPPPAPSLFFPRPQNGLATKVMKSRKQMKERRNRARKIRGAKKSSGES